MSTTGTEMASVCKELKDKGPGVSESPGRDGLGAAAPPTPFVEFVAGNCVWLPLNI